MSNDGIEDGENYEVGYKKPPKSGQFQKGRSGNPHGSSKSVRARKTKKPSIRNLFAANLQQAVKVMENGKPVLMTKLHKAVRKRVEEAAKGNMAALKELLKLREMKDAGPINPGRQLILSLDEARVMGPLGFGLHRPDTVILRMEKPSEAGAPRKHKPSEAGPALPQRSVGELIEIELDREVQATDQAAGITKRMTMREVIVEQLIRHFVAGKAGIVDLLLKLNSQSDLDPKEPHKNYVAVPWDYVLPPPCDASGRPLTDGKAAEAASPLSSST